MGLCSAVLVTKMFAFRIARRSFAKLMGIAGFLLGLVGGALIGYSALTGGGLSPISLFVRLLEGLLGLGAIIAGVIIYTGPMRFGGFIDDYSSDYRPKS